MVLLPLTKFLQCDEKLNGMGVVRVPPESQSTVSGDVIAMPAFAPLLTDGQTWTNR